MIVLTQSAPRTVVMTVTEKTTLSNPYYLFVFESRQATGHKVVLIAENTSTITVRYDEFTISHSTTPDPYNGEGDFTYTGEYAYTVYQKTGAQTLDIPASEYIVETGICKVMGEESSNTTYGYQPELKVYE